MAETDTTLSEEVKSTLSEAAENLHLLVRFHDRELDAGFLHELRQFAVGDWFQASASHEAAVELDKALAQLPTTVDEAALDLLASEFADIYLCHSYRIAPTGSVWLTEESLERREPMFEVREFYRKYSIQVPNWRMRPDDHIVHELQFLAHLCELASDEAIKDAACFLDLHMLNWIPDFAHAIEERARQAVHVASAKLTAAVLEELRDQLETLTGIARPENNPQPRRNVVRLIDIDLEKPFVPGINESW